MSKPIDTPSRTSTNSDTHEKTNSRHSVKKSWDESFCFELISIEVEDTMFCVPKHGFIEDGSAFSDMYCLPLPADSLGKVFVEGGSAAKPIVLEGISLEHFRALLRVMYPFTGHFTPLTYDEWVGVLHLADMWGLQKIRQSAVAQLTSLLTSRTACEKIVLGERYDVHSWLVDGYLGTILGEGIPTIEDLLEKGLNTLTVAHIFRIREMIRSDWPLNRKYSVERYANPQAFPGSLNMWTKLTCNDCQYIHTCQDQASYPKNTEAMAVECIRDALKIELTLQ